MIERLLPPAILVATLGSGLIAGTFFAFSNFVMPALARVTTGAGLASMQSINVVVLNPLFLGVFVGTAGVSLALGIAAILRWGQPGSPYILAGALLYVLGCFAVTMAYNVPLNEALATIDPDAADASARWTDYIARWSLGNHVRTLASLAAGVLFTLGLRAQ